MLDRAVTSPTTRTSTTGSVGWRDLTTWSKVSKVLNTPGANGESGSDIPWSTISPGNENPKTDPVTGDAIQFAPELPVAQDYDEVHNVDDGGQWKKINGYWEWVKTPTYNDAYWSDKFEPIHHGVGPQGNPTAGNPTVPPPGGTLPEGWGGRGRF